MKEARDKKEEEFQPFFSKVAAIFQHKAFIKLGSRGPDARVLFLFIPPPPPTPRRTAHTYRKE
jgi:hypothetical protein